jgi:hypothetical protein
MFKIVSIKTSDDWKINFTLGSGESRSVDIRPFLQYEAFEDLRDIAEFHKIRNGGYYVEWDSGADLSLDTLLAKSGLS